MAPQAGRGAPGAADAAAALPPGPLSAEGIERRHENRQVLLRHISGLRGRIQLLEQEVAKLEETVHRLPYDLQSPAAGVGQAPASRRFGPAACALGGGVALPLAIGCMHPLDTIRTHMQAALHAEQDFASAWRSIGWRGFFRGIGPSIAWAAPQGAIRLACYESCKASLSAGALGPGAAAVALSAVVGDLASSFVKVPRELITQRMQTGRYASGAAAVRSILRDDGPAGLLRGYASTCLRDAPFMVLLFISYEQFKAWKIRVTFADRGPMQILSPWSDTESVVWGGVSGAIAALLTTPFDVVKTRIMTASRHVGLREALHAVGPYGLFAGAGPRSAWWFCVCSIFFTTYERLRAASQDALDRGR